MESRVIQIRGGSLIVSSINMTISSWFPFTPSQICLDDPPYNNKQPFHFLVVDEDFQKHHKIQRADPTQINVRSELAGSTQNTDLNKLK